MVVTNIFIETVDMKFEQMNHFTRFTDICQFNSSYTNFTTALNNRRLQGEKDNCTLPTAGVVLMIVKISN